MRVDAERERSAVVPERAAQLYEVDARGELEGGAGAPAFLGAGLQVPAPEHVGVERRPGAATEQELVVGSARDVYAELVSELGGERTVRLPCLDFGGSVLPLTIARRTRRCGWEPSR